MEPRDYARKRLEKQHTILQSEWERRTDKLVALSNALVIETATNIKFQLEEQIQVEKSEIKRLENELLMIEQTLNNVTVFPTSQTPSHENNGQTSVPKTANQRVMKDQIDQVIEALKPSERNRRFSTYAGNWLEVNLERLATQTCEAVIAQDTNLTNEEKCKFQTDIEYYLELVAHTLKVYESTVFEHEEMEFYVRISIQRYIQALEYILEDSSGSIADGLSWDAIQELKLRLGHLIKIFRRRT